MQRVIDASLLTAPLCCSLTLSCCLVFSRHNQTPHLPLKASIPCLPLTAPPPPQAPDPSLIAEPVSLKDVRLFKLHREAPHKLYLLLK